jgi:hypothetical protein
VQIHGGMGFSGEMMIDKGYRDSRINKIFEGTNEINRLLLVDSVLKKEAKGVLPIFKMAEEAFKEVQGLNGAPVPATGYLEEKDQYIASFKKVVLMLLKSASDTFQRELGKEQEILSNISDCIIQTYAAESVVLRLKKMETMKSEAETALYRDMADVFVYDTATRIRKFASDSANSYAVGEVAVQLEKGISYLTSVAGVNVKEARRRIADRLIEENKYCF